MPKVHVILISSVLPEPSSAGQVILHRHLIGREDIDLQVFGSEPARLTPSSAIRRVLGRLGRTSLRKFATDLSVLWKGRWLDPLLREAALVHTGSIVVTVAHGDGCMAAMRFARKHDLPLVTFFHDWWPDIVSAHARYRRKVERDFLELHRASSLSLSVSEGMREALGEHLNSRVLFPIPSSHSEGESREPSPSKGSEPFRILYFGNLREYGPMLKDALDALRSEPSIQLEVRGVNPAWSSGFKKEMRDCGSWLEFAPKDELEDWLATADAFLIPQVFEIGLRRQMMTNFPSKLSECTRFGKPIVIWAPEDGSASRWGQENKKAMCVSSETPESLVTALQSLVASPETVDRLGKAALRAAATEFNPAEIHKEFIESLELLESGR